MRRRAVVLGIGIPAALLLGFQVWAFVRRTLLEEINVVNDFLRIGDALEQRFSDRGAYPESLTRLVQEGYIPSEGVLVDPFKRSFLGLVRYSSRAERYYDYAVRNGRWAVRSFYWNLLPSLELEALVSEDPQVRSRELKGYERRARRIYKGADIVAVKGG